MYELHLLCPEDTIEALSDALTDLDALSISVEDADADTQHETPLFGEPGMPVEHTGWQRSLLRALFAAEAAACEAASVLAATYADSPAVQVLDIHHVPDQDWVRLTQSQFTPVEITPDFWIVPSWHDVPAQAQQVIALDPGLAFGTGTHPTTRMCLRWIARHGQPGRPQALGRVLDYGCGSGILAIGAAKYGAAHIDATDIDPAAIEASRANAAANHVTIHACLPDDMPAPAAGYQTVLANILASPLKVLAPLLCSHIAPGGHLILAGILERQAQELQEAYAPYVQLHVADHEDGWILMTAQMPV